MYKIALIEDEKILSNMMVSELHDAGFTVILAYDGEEGVKLVRKQKPDLVLLDLLMPKKSGMDVLKELKSDKATKDIPIFILTVSSTGKSAKEYLDSGADDFMVKSQFSMKEITDKINTQLGNV